MDIHTTFERGSFLAWERDTFNWNVSSSTSKITSSSYNQTSGWVFPNIVKKLGANRYEASGTVHKWNAKKSIGAGTVTPWGDVKVYNIDYLDSYGLYSTGKATWY